MNLKGPSYFNDVKNNMDWLGVVFYISYCLFYLLEGNGPAIYVLKVAAITLTLQRGILTFFNMFDGTRYLVRMMMATI